ncbi:FadR/GntR family transcriptional regulator [Kytococcus sp. Marseille-QA3725]
MTPPPTSAQGAAAPAPRSGGRAYQVVLDWVERGILAGDLSVGSRLPAERELAAQLGLSRAAVREAIRTLQAQGIVRSAVGAGEHGGTTITPVEDGAMGRMLRLHVQLGHFPLDHVIEVRTTLECLSARLACARRTDEHLATMAGLVEQMEQSQDDRDRFNDLDTRFHVALAEAAGNRLATDSTAALRESMRQPIRERMRSSREWGRIAPRLVEDHRAILRAIEERDAAEAERLLVEHIQSAWQRLNP